jgi:tRNA A-37 threonylcarbamoyl transferase component Bud32/tetratricopeptide (TPR) repeat protein
MDQLVIAGTVLGGRYVIDREIGRGGMATVFVAEDLRQRRRVAVKILRPDVALALGSQRFLSEIEIASRLTHPHILPVHDSGEDAGVLYYVMPYVEGESLREKLNRGGRLPVEEALAIAREIADALAYAHDLDVVHRDIKPGNVLLLAGHAVVADFGVARAISAAADERVTSAGFIVGTPVYMSPEQAAGDTLDGRADVYGLGCVAYEMLTGTPPFLGETPHEVFAKHRSARPRPVRDLRPEVPVPAAEAIERALGKLPEDRFASSREFAAALRAPAQWERGQRPHRGAGLIALAAVLAVAAGLAVRADRQAGADLPAPPAILVLPLDGDSAAASAGGLGADARFAELIGWMPGLRGTRAEGLPRGGWRWADLPLPELLAWGRKQGGRYLLAGELLPQGAGRRVTVDLYATATGERLSHAVDTTAGADVGPAIGRLAADVVRTVARREGLQLGAAGAVLASTNVMPAVGHMMQAQQKFWASDLAGTASELHAAVEADSSCGLAYLRLSEAERWRHDSPAALEAVEAGLRRTDGMAPRWAQLLEAQRYLVLGYGDSAIATFQSAVLDERDDVDGWLGLGEALVHYGGFSGASPQDARPAFERLAALDSTFAPIYYHLVDLAVYAGDSQAATSALGRVPPDHPYRPSKVAEVRLRFGPPGERAAALAALRSADRQAISEAVVAWAHGAFNLGLADTAAGFLLGADRLPDDRLRGADYRLAIRAATSRWAEGYAGWDSVARSVTIDPWLVQAVLAGFPARDRTASMFEWARAQLRAGRTPDFTLHPWDDLRQGFEALVYRAVVEGDSAETGELLRRIDRAPPPPPSEPAADALRWSLRARLALLAQDTTGAIAGLRRAVARIPETHTANYPLTAAGPQRFLLARLLLARGDSAGAERWRRSFTGSWAVGDLFYLPALDSLGPSRTRSAP